MHPLWGPIRKIERAKEQLSSLVDEIDFFLASDSYGIAVEAHDPRTGTYSLRARVTREVEPPLEWSIRIGEIAYNARSCLDQLACAIARTNYSAHQPPEKLWRVTSFPIFLRGPRSNRVGQRRWSDNMQALEFMTPQQRRLLQRF